MKVRIIKPYAVMGPNGMRKPGEEIDLPEDVAKRLASEGKVRLLEPVKEAEGVKRRAKTKEAISDENRTSETRINTKAKKSRKRKKR